LAYRQLPRHHEDSSDSPLIESVTPRLYGGTERIVSYLTEELVAQGRDVTIFASADSVTSARLVPCCEQALRHNPAVRDPIPYCMIMLDKLHHMAAQFDILHFHIDQFHFPIFHDRPLHALTTLHGRQDLPDLKVLAGMTTFPKCRLSQYHRRSANQFGMPISLARCCTASPAICCRRPCCHVEDISPFWAAYPQKRVLTAQSQLRTPWGCSKPDRADEAYLRRDIAPARSARYRVHWRDR
jgi:Glycosyltransferase Family 4